MTKKQSILTLFASLFPQTTLAHFEASHEPLWHQPMHWVLQHYQGMLIVGLGMAIALIYIRSEAKEK